MPDYLQGIRVDWGWPQLTYRERKLVRLHEARLQADPETHTLRTLGEMLAAASRELAGRTLRAEADDAGETVGLVAQGGRCVEAEVALSPDGAFPDPLTPDDFRAAGVTRLLVSLFWPEELLQAVTTRAAELDVSLSALVERAWKLAGRESQQRGSALPLPTGGARRRQSVYLPLEVWSELREQAEREGCSLSTLVQRVLASAWDRLRPG